VDNSVHPRTILWVQAVDEDIASAYRSRQPEGAEPTLTAAMTSTPTRRVRSFGRFAVRGIGAGGAGRRTARPVPWAVRTMIPAVIPLPLLLLGAGVAFLVAAALVLRSFGPGYRLGRLLASTPHATIAEALSRARRGDARYVRVVGRIDSAAEFEDEHHRPLVFWRRRIEVRLGDRWETLDEQRQAVAFEVREGLASVAIDTDGLDEGLVVIPREATGTAADAREHVGAQMPDDTPVRMRVEQVSSVEHATVLGVPVAVDGDSVVMSPGNGRPLILTTLELPEAMRLLAGGRRTLTGVAVTLLAIGAAAVVVGLAWSVVGGLR
jgi:hypothetical protein